MKATGGVLCSRQLSTGTAINTSLTVLVLICRGEDKSSIAGSYSAVCLFICPARSGCFQL